jgi:hypothetical protein
VKNRRPFPTGFVKFPAVRRPWSALVLAASGLLLLVSLYMPWGSTTSNFDDDVSGGLIHLFDNEVGAWSATASTACAVVALYLVASGAAAWFGGSRTARIPLAAPALFAAYLAVATAVETRTAQQDSRFGFQYARGAYLGVTAGALIVGSALALRRSSLRRATRPPALGLLGTALAIAMLVLLLLPWERATFRFEGSSANIVRPGISEPASVVVALAAVLLATMFWHDRADAGWKRLVLASAVVLFTLGALSAADPVLNRTYEAWTALAIALALVLVAIVCTRVRVAFVKRVGWRELALGAAAALFLGSLFLPWQEERLPVSFAPDPRAGHSVSLNAWILIGTAAGALALGLLVIAVGRLRDSVHPLALAAGTTLFAGAAAVELGTGSTREVSIDLAYGAFVGVACAALAVVLALPHVSKLEWREIGSRSIPVVLCIAYLAIVIIPPLSHEAIERPTLFFAPTSWLTVAGAVVAILLVQAWVKQATDRAWLLALPLSMLALAIVDVVRLRHDLAWGAAVVVGISIVLSGLGRIEQRGGLSELRVPEIFRVDRI